MTMKPYEMIIDFATGRRVPDMGSEANRQIVERFLVHQKGYARSDIRPDATIRFEVAGEAYHSQIDLLVSIDGEGPSGLVVKCAAGSLGSYEREALAAARILESKPIPFAVVSDGASAAVLETVTGRKWGEGLYAIPSKAEVHEYLAQTVLGPFDPKRLERERLIFRSYDAMKVNTARHLASS